MRIAADFGSDGTRKDWIVDSGASEHFISDTGELDYVADDDPGGKVAVANGVVCPVTAIGPVTLRVKGFRPTGRAGEQRDEPIITTIRLGRVSVVPALTKRLLSVRRLFECDGVRVEFNGRDLLTLPSGYTVPLNTAEGRFRLDTESALSAVAAADSDDVRLWHERLGHFNPGRIIDALRHRGYSISRGCDLGNCTACLLNRRRKGHPDHPTNARIYTHFGERISSDLCGPFPPSPHGFTFAINFVDHYSTVIAVYFLRDPVNAEQVINAARAFMRDHAHLLVKTRVACVVDEWHCDNGTQFTSASVEEFCAVLAIQRTFSPADVHEGNAVAERAWGLLLRCTRAAIAHAGGGVKQAQFWPFLFLQFSLVHNWLDTNRGSAKSPHWVVPMQKASSTVRVFDLQRLRVVLCDCTCVIKTEERAHKLTPTRIKAIHLGYDVRRRGYFVYIPEIGRITSSNDVYFDERSFTLLGGVMSNVKLRGGIRTQNITPPAPPPTTPCETDVSAAIPRDRPGPPSGCCGARKYSCPNCRGARCTTCHWPTDVSPDWPRCMCLDSEPEIAAEAAPVASRRQWADVKKEEDDKFFALPIEWPDQCPIPGPTVKNGTFAWAERLIECIQEMSLAETEGWLNPIPTLLALRCVSDGTMKAFDQAAVLPFIGRAGPYFRAQRLAAVNALRHRLDCLAMLTRLRRCQSVYEQACIYHLDGSAAQVLYTADLAGPLGRCHGLAVHEPALPGTAPPVVVDAFVPADANAIELARRCDGAWELSDFVIGASADTSASVHYRSGTVGEVLEVSAQIGPVPIPRSAEDAVKHPLYGKSWLAAMTDDFVGKSQDNGAWELVAKLPPGKRAIKGKWVFRVFYKDDGSVDRFKARWVACGYSQRPGIDYLETYCGTLRIETLLIFLADCNANDDELERWDVVKAFTSTTKLDVEMYVEQPHGFVDPKFKACRLLKGLEGTKQGGAIFQKENTAVLKACGFEQCTADPNLFRIIFDDGGYIIAVVYVDDIFVRYQSPTKGRVDTTFARYCRSFKATRVSEPRRMVGFDIARDRPARKLRVFQTNYVCELYKKYLSSQCSKDFTTPVQSSRCPEFMAMTGATCEEDDRAVADKPFLPLMGGLNWIGWTRPDIKFYNARLCCFMHRPKIENYEAALAVLSYLYTTRDLGLEFSASSNLDGVVYCDSSYNQIPDTFYGHGVWYGGAPVASCSRVLRLGAQSSYESESFAYAGASMSLRFCQQVAVFGGGGFKMPTTIRTDSNGVVLATRNGGVTSRNRHFEKFLRLGRLHYEDNISSPEFVPTSDQCADIWTKALDKTTFLKHRAKLVR